MIQRIHREIAKMIANATQMRRKSIVAMELVHLIALAKVEFITKSLGVLQKRIVLLTLTIHTAVTINALIMSALLVK